MPGLEGLVSEVIASGRTQERDLLHSSGRSFAIRVDPYRGTEGTIEGATVLIVDITALRRGEDAQIHLAAIVESSEDSIVSKTLDGTITSWNRGAELLYGYTAAETVGRPISILIPQGRPDELPSIMERLARGERIEHYETVRRRKDGTLLDVSVSISPVRNVRGEIVGAAAITRDISANKAAKALLRFQIEAGNALAHAGGGPGESGKSCRAVPGRLLPRGHARAERHTPARRHRARQSIKDRGDRRYGTPLSDFGARGSRTVARAPDGPARNAR
jgi:PAS domain S-box-containing protein